MVNIIKLFFLFGISFSEYVPLPPNYKCPPPNTRIIPFLDHKVTFESKTKLYKYDYALSNEGGLLPITSLYLYVSEPPINGQSPLLKKIDPLEQWETVAFFGGRVGWYTAGDSLSNGKKIDGFKLSSYQKPGIIKFTASGFIEETPHVDAECPDHFQDLPAEQRQIVGATVGPVPDSFNQIDGDIEFESRKHRGKVPQIDPLDRGEVEIYLKDSDNFEIADIDIGSLEFGPGKAKVKRHSFINEHGKECSSHDFRRKHKKRKLKLVFKLEEIKVRCNLDYALFLKGKVGDKNILAAQEMKPVVCEPKHFNKN